nr:lipopolysaccharide assembly protein LapA domain-containing protein [Ancylobacter crimeensis]
MRRIGLILIVLPLSLVAILLAVANRQAVAVNLDPFAGSYGIEVPLFLLVFGSLILGVVLGGVAVWAGQLRYRRAARRARRDARDAEREAGELRERMAAMTDPDGRGVPGVAAGYAITDRRNAA